MECRYISLSFKEIFPLEKAKKSILFSIESPYNFLVNAPENHPATAVFITIDGQECKLVQRQNIQEMLNLLVHRMHCFKSALPQLEEQQKKEFGSCLRNEMLDCRFWLLNEVKSMNHRSDLRERYMAAADYLEDAAACMYDMAYEGNGFVDFPVLEGGVENAELSETLTKEGDSVVALVATIAFLLGAALALDQATGGRASSSISNTVQSGIEQLIGEQELPVEEDGEHE